MQPLFVHARDNTPIACWDFSPSEDASSPIATVLLVHGTGLCAQCWSPVAAKLAEKGVRALALDARGHGASGRSPNGAYPWRSFGWDVLDVAEKVNVGSLVDGTQPLLGAGHSAGATALLLAEADRPGTLAGIWAWEPIVPTPSNKRLSQLSAELAQRALRRRATFSSLEDARAYLGPRGMFAEFSPDALDGFLAGGLVADAGEDVKLACAPEDEAAIYDGARDLDVGGLLRDVRCPVQVVGGEASTSVTPPELGMIASALPQGCALTVPGLGHFGPFQAPGVIASEILAWAAKTL